MDWFCFTSWSATQLFQISWAVNKTNDVLNLVEDRNKQL